MSTLQHRQASGEIGVELKGIVKRFGDSIAIDRLDLQVHEGEFFSLLGPSGCGKTTTLRIVAGFEQPTAGSVAIRQRDVTALPPYQRNFGMVFQNFALFPHLTITQNVAFGLKMRRVDAAAAARKVEAALELVSLQGFGKRYPRELSGGQQQRVAIARAIVFEPDVLLLDESLSALDKVLREQMQVELRTLQRRLGMTTIFVTHDQEEAMTMSDSIAVMQAGRIQQIGAPRDVYERPANEFVANFLGAANVIEGRLSGREAGADLVDVFGCTCAVPSNGEARSAGATLKLALRPENLFLSDAASGVPATLTNVVYKGAQTQIFTDIAGQAIVMDLPTQKLSGDLVPGQRVHVGWDPKHLVPLHGALA
ncbi:ABC transporter ATP-binding protein [Paraburkholderia sp.]|jgi:spermidine/putrescine ABC transporter ATP-binding subunit|uniref:ABC transporter ATP-binding protein n=1 Tax=Paraburkholderia sp. TaxID=1926495 RepID=UPI002F420A8D